MMVHKRYIFLLLVLIVPSTSLAQLRSHDQNNVNFSSALRNGGGQVAGVLNFLGLDPSKFSISHSYSLAFGSFGGQTLSQGVYLNTMRYQVSAPLQVALQWGVTHSPLQSQTAPGMGSQFFISGASVDFQPSKNFNVGIQYSSHPAGSRYRYPYTMTGQNQLFDGIGRDNQ